MKLSNNPDGAFTHLKIERAQTKLIKRAKYIHCSYVQTCSWNIDTCAESYQCNCECCRPDRHTGPKQSVFGSVSRKPLLSSCLLYSSWKLQRWLRLVRLAARCQACERHRCLGWPDSSRCVGMGRVRTVCHRGCAVAVCPPAVWKRKRLPQCQKTDQTHTCIHSSYVYIYTHRYVYICR